MADFDSDRRRKRFEASSRREGRRIERHFKAFKDARERRKLEQQLQKEVYAG